MKKITFLFIIAIIFCLLTGCNLAEERAKRNDKLLQIVPSGNYGIVGEVEYRSKDTTIVYKDYIEEILKKDNIEISTESPYFCIRFYNNKLFFVYTYDMSNFPKSICGYIDLSDEIKLNCKYEYVDSFKPQTEIYYIDNANCVLRNKVTSIKKYLVWDYINNTISEYDDKPIYIEDGKTSSIKEYEYNLKTYNVYQSNRKVCIINSDTKEERMIDVGYILEKSEEYKKINAIYDCYSKSRGVDFLISQNELYIYVFSVKTMMGKGELNPVVFKYNIETEQFNYIGCVLYGDEVIGIIEK